MHKDPDHTPGLCVYGHDTEKEQIREFVISNRIKTL